MKIIEFLQSDSEKCLYVYGIHGTGKSNGIKEALQGHDSYFIDMANVLNQIAMRDKITSEV